MYWNEYKTKSENKYSTNEYIYFLESNFVRVTRQYVLVYSNAANDAKRYSAKKYYLLKDIINKYDFIVNGKNFYGQPIDSDIKRYREIATGQGDVCKIMNISKVIIGHGVLNKWVKPSYRLC